MIKTFNLNKAIGPNSIPVIILKEIKKEISEPLSTIINLSFDTGDFPNCLKLAKVIPVYKKGDQQECNNYRPISLLSNISKLIEKLLYNRLYKFLNQNKYLFNYQFGLRNHHSTNHTLISITEKIRKALDEGKFVCGVFLGFQKAFDTVNHKIRISKLEHYGIRGLPLHLFQNYLENQTRFVNINKKSSNVLPINHGVPQASVLGPLLFLIYINDLNGVVNFPKIHSNSKQFLKNVNRKINHDLRSIAEWLKANKIFLNSGKTELVLFRSKDKKITKNMNFRISGQKINIISETKYLGSILYEHLTFKHHLQNLKLKLNRAIFLLSKRRCYIKFPLL